MHNIGFAPAPYCCGNHRAAKGHVGEVGNLWRCRPGDLWLRNQGCVVGDVGDPRLRNQGRVVGDLGDVGDHWLCNQVRAGGVSVLQFRRRCRPCNQGCVGDFPLFQRCFGIQAAARFSCQDRRGFAIQAAARQAGGQSKSLAPPRSSPLPPGVRVARLTTTTISSIRLPLPPTAPPKPKKKSHKNFNESPSCLRSNACEMIQIFAARPHARGVCWSAVADSPVLQVLAYFSRPPPYQCLLAPSRDPMSLHFHAIKNCISMQELMVRMVASRSFLYSCGVIKTFISSFALVRSRRNPTLT